MNNRGIVNDIANQFTGNTGTGGGLQNQILHKVEGMIPGAGGMGAQHGGITGQSGIPAAGGVAHGGGMQQQLFNQVEHRVEGMLPGNTGHQVGQMLHPHHGGAVPSGGATGGLPQQISQMAGGHGQHGGVVDKIKNILH